MATFDEDGRQVPDQRPVEVTVDLRRPLTLQEEIRRFVRTELSVRAASVEMESFEEADDFGVDEDDDLHSPYELFDMAPEGPEDASDLSGKEKPPADAGKSQADSSPAKPSEASGGSPLGGADSGKGVGDGSPV